MSRLLSAQVVKFAIVGLVSNAVLYILYLALTRTGLEPKLVMSMLYLVGVVQTFVFNKKWTFRHEGRVTRTLVAYVALYAFGYLVNLGILVFFVDARGYRHELVQGMTILLLAMFFFLAQKFIIFRSNGHA